MSILRGLRIALVCGLLWVPATAASSAASSVATAAAGAAEESPEPPAAAAPSRAAPSKIRFEEVGEQAGARFVHSTRKFRGLKKRDVLEMFTDGGSAAAVGDFNGDGLDDLFLTDSDTGKASHLLRNDGQWKFTEVTEAAGVGGGNDPLSIVADALWLDFDNDGFLDLLVARFGTPLLYRSLGPGADGAFRFQEVAQEAGLTAFGNTIAVIAFDGDNDGDLDLLLGNYFPPENLLELKNPHVLPNNLDYADNGGGVTYWRNDPAPSAAKETADRTGGRVFVNATAAAGFGHHTGWSLDLGHGDLNNDGLQDVYIAGDYGTDRLFFNRGGGRFEDVTEQATGLDTKKGMNVDLGDYDRDGWLDIYVTNITDEYMKECNMLWHNVGDGTFIEISRETGTCDTDWGWAAKFADFDNDGWEDLLVVNGLRSRGEGNYIPVLLEAILSPTMDFSDVNSYPDIGEMTWSGYQKQRLFHNLGDGTFKEIGAEAGVDNDLDGRGLAVADFDGDGLLDYLQTNANQPSLLFRGRAENAGSWIELRLEGKRSNRQAIGARVLVKAGGTTFLREVNGGNGYSSQSSTRLHFGLGAAQAVERVEVRWPSGLVEVLESRDGKPPVSLNALTVLREGAHTPLERTPAQAEEASEKTSAAGGKSSGGDS